MLPISPSAETPTSEPGSTPRRAQSSSASDGGKSSRTIASRSPPTGSTTPVTVVSGGPTASTASASGSATAFGTETSIVLPSRLESAVAAFPEPMLASSRRASSCRSVYLVTLSVLLSGCVHDRRPVGGRSGKGVAVDDQGDLAVGEDGTAGEGGPAGERRGEGSGNQLALADERIDGHGKTAIGAADDDRVAGLRRRVVAERPGEVEQRQDAVALDEDPLAGDRAHDLLAEQQRALDAVELDRKGNRSRLDDERGHDRQRQRQTDLCRRPAAGLGGEQDLA